MRDFIQTCRKFKNLVYDYPRQDFKTDPLLKEHNILHSKHQLCQQLIPTITQFQCKGSGYHKADFSLMLKLFPYRFFFELL